MPEAVQYEQFDRAPTSAGGERLEADLRRLSEVAMELSVEIGRASMTVGETLELRPGSVITLERLAGEPVDLLVNGTPIARGEVVVVDEQFGLRAIAVHIDKQGNYDRKGNKYEDQPDQDSKDDLLAFRHGIPSLLAKADAPPGPSSISIRARNHSSPDVGNGCSIL